MNRKVIIHPDDFDREIFISLREAVVDMPIEWDYDAIGRKRDSVIAEKIDLILQNKTAERLSFRCLTPLSSTELGLLRNPGPLLPSYKGSVPFRSRKVEDQRIYTSSQQRRGSIDLYSYERREPRQVPVCLC